MSDSRDALQSALTPSGENPLKRWFLLTGRRTSVMVALMGAVFVVLLVLALVRPIGMEDLLNETAAVRTLFSALLSGAILLVTIVVSINSITLSEEMTDIEDQRRRLDATLEYHRQVESFIQAPITPARPADFIYAVVFAISTQTTRLVELANEQNREAYDEDLDRFSHHVAEEIDVARDTLSGASLGSFQVLLAGLNFDFSGQLQAARGLRETYGDDLEEDELATIEDLIDTLKFIGTGREYFKSLYFKRELSKLSSHLLFVTLPVIVFTSYVILAMDPDFIPQVTVLGIPPLVLALAIAYTVALAPYILLTAYVVRVATVTLRTLAAGPFIFQRGSDIESFQWDGVEPSREWKLSEALEERE